MRLPARNCWSSLFKLLCRNRLLHPPVFVYCVTARCNLNCAYCEGLGDGQAEAELGLADALDAQRWANTIGAPAEVAQAIFDPIRTYAHRQDAFGYRMVVNCVLTPETLPGAGALLGFCLENGLLVSFSHRPFATGPAMTSSSPPSTRRFSCG